MTKKTEYIWLIWYSLCINVSTWEITINNIEITKDTWNYVHFDILEKDGFHRKSFPVKKMEKSVAFADFNYDETIGIKNFTHNRKKWYEYYMLLGWINHIYFYTFDKRVLEIFIKEYIAYSTEQIEKFKYISDELKKIK